MKGIDKTKNELFKELEETRRKVRELDICQAEYEKARDKYEKLLDSTPDAMLFVNTRNKIILVNAQFERLFGYSQKEIIGRTLDILVPDRYRTLHRKFVNNFFRDPKVRLMGSHFEIYARKGDGKEFPADISLSPLQTDEELLVTAAVRDITRRKEVEEQVELNYAVQKVINAMLSVSLQPIPLAQQFDRILDLILNVPNLSLQSKGAIFLKDPNAEMLHVKAQRGFTRKAPLPCTEIPVGHCLCGKAAETARLIYAEDMDQAHEVHLEGMFPHGHYCVPILSGKNLYGMLNIYLKRGHKRNSREEDFLTAVASTLATIIERDKAETEKKNLQHQLSQAEKLAALGRFTANIAHEIRNPLTSVGGFARRLGKVIPANSKEKDYAEIIIAEVTRLEKTLKNILSFSKETSPNLTENDLAEVIGKSLPLLEALFKEKSITVIRSLAYIPRFSFDRDLIIEALENIFINAIDSMTNGGTLTVFTGLDGESGSQKAVIKISDTGTGISKDRMKLIFEPFYTTKPSEKGTGLGLSITRKIMELLGGGVQIQSEEGEGTTVILTLPFKR